MKKVEYWRWRYRNSDGQICQTLVQMSEAEAVATYKRVERIVGSMSLRAVAEKPESNADEQSELPSCRD